MKKIAFIVLCIWISLHGYAQISTPYYEGFEGGFNQWGAYTVLGTGWNVTSPPSIIPHTGTQVAALGYTGSTYQANSESYFISPAFDFSTLSNPVLSFWKYHHIEPNYDGVRIEYSTDSTNWYVLGNVGNGCNWYNKSLVNSSGLPGWAGTDTTWKNSLMNMAPVAGQSHVNLRFVFTSDIVVNQFDGFLIDDIIIDDAANFDFMSANYTYSNFSNCGFNQVNFNLWGLNSFATGSLSALINFGDGKDTTINFIGSSNLYSLSFSHRYNYAGNFSVQYIVYDGIGNADTLNQLSVIGLPTNCGDITGRVYRDNNGNCIFNTATDSVVSNFPVKVLTPTGQTIFAFTDTLGNYYFQVQQTGSYSLRTGAYQNYGYSSSCPTAGYYLTSIPATNKNFALTCSPAFDLQATLSSDMAVPGLITHTYVATGNYSCQPVSGSIDVTLDSKLSLQNAIPPPDIINGSLLTWNFISLAGSFTPISISSLTDTTATLGDTVCNTVVITPVAGDSVPANNAFSQCQPVATSFDPNEKTVAPEGNIENTTELTYTVFFQNTGTATAYNIHIFDTLDSNLDVNALRIIGHSHPIQVKVYENNRLHFAFNNILLPDSNANEPLSHGYVIYKIKPFDTIPDGVVIRNTAYIYFDYNSPIVTNTTFNHISLGVGSTELSAPKNGLTVFPNPALENLTLTFYEGQRTIFHSIKIFDVLGKEVYSAKMSGSNFSIPVSALQKGIYFLEVSDNKATARQKFVKQ